MATMTDHPLKTMTLARAEVAALTLGQVALDAAVEVLRAGRYRPNREELRRISKGLTAAALAGAPAVLDPTIPDETIEEAAQEAGRLVVESVLGPPPPEALN